MNLHFKTIPLFKKYLYLYFKLDTTPILEKDLIDKKRGILDVKVVADKINNIDIEMQVVKSEHIAERILFYWSKMYNKTIRQGCGYERAQKAICILIADFKQ